MSRLLPYVQRYWWIGRVAVVAICLFYAGRAVSNLIEPSVVGESTAHAAPAAPPAPRPAPVALDKSGKALVARNVFCSACQPEAPAATAAATDGIQETQLPLELIATSIGDSFRMATVLDTSSQVQGGYLVGNSMPGAGPIVASTYQHVDFQNPSQGNRVERLSLLATRVTIETPPAAAPPAAAPTSADPMTAAIDAGVRQLGDGSYEIDRSLIDQVMANPMSVAKGGRIMPTPQGLKVYSLRPGSAYAKLGLKNGDTIASVNGLALDSLDASLGVVEKLKDSSQLTIDVVRGGKPVTLQYAIK